MSRFKVGDVVHSEKLKRTFLILKLIKLKKEMESYNVYYFHNNTIYNDVTFSPDEHYSSYSKIPTSELFKD